MSLNCGSGISDTCKTDTFYMVPKKADGTYDFSNKYTAAGGLKEWTMDRSARRLIAEINSIATFMITVSLAAGTEGMSDNVIKGINALRCAMMSGLLSVWKLVAAVFYIAAEVQTFGIYDLYDLLQDYLNEYYPYVCTCKEDVQAFGEFFGAGSGSTSNFAEC